MGQHSALRGVLAHEVERGVKRGAHRPASTYKPPYGLKHFGRDAWSPNSARPAGTSFSACWRRGAQVRIGAVAFERAQRFGPLVVKHQADEEWKDEHGLPLEGLFRLSDEIHQPLYPCRASGEGDRFRPFGQACAECRREGLDDIGSDLQQIIQNGARHGRLGYRSGGDLCPSRRPLVSLIAGCVGSGDTLLPAGRRVIPALLLSR